MNEGAGNEECSKKCVPNCEEVTYQTTMDTRYLNKEDFCDTDHLFRSIFSSGQPKEFRPKLKEWVSKSAISAKSRKQPKEGISASFWPK